MTNYKQLCYELFGTTDIKELQRIAHRAEFGVKTGRKRALSDADQTKMLRLQQQGMTVKDIADVMGVSRQTVSKYLNRKPDENYVMRIDYMWKQYICTEIYVDFCQERIQIINRIGDWTKCAFGKVENPSWDDFQFFLQSRCFPESRGNTRQILHKMGLSSYDTLQIVEKTEGRTPDDNQYLKFTYKGVAND